MQEIARIPVDATKVCIGMYVTMLDRPWLETPFVFQGFEVRDRVEIEQLQTYCRFVYVDVERSRLNAAQIHALRSDGEKANFPTRPAHAPVEQPTIWWQRIAVRFGLRNFLETRAKVIDAHPYAVSSTVRGEAARARQAYEDGVELLKRIRKNALENGRVEANAVGSIVRPVMESILRNPDAMAWTVFSKKRGGRNYSRALATSVWCIMFGRHLGFERGALLDLGTGGLLLDIGNIRLPDELIDTPGAITEEQYQYVTQHVSAGMELLRKSGGFNERVLEMVRCHHERHDGSGYPEGLKGNKIPTFGRIAGIADSYDAMTSKTAYSPALAAYEAAGELNSMRDKGFQAEVVGQFLQTIGMFPTGSIVELSDGKVGVVLEQNRIHPLRPKVMLLLEKNGKAFTEPQILNLTEEDEDAAASEPAWIEKGHEHGAFGIDPQVIFA